VPGCEGLDGQGAGVVEGEVLERGRRAPVECLKLGVGFVREEDDAALVWGGETDE